MLEVEDLVVVLGELQVLNGLNLEVDDGQMVAVLGPSGSGKSTLLRVVAGLLVPRSGRVLWDGRDLAGVPTHRRGFGLMFQDFALFPHKNVAANVAFGLRMAGEEPAAVKQKVDEALGWVGLDGYQERPVTALSGGEQQRVALARALAPSPRLLMLDEPLGALDRVLRDRLLPELRDLLRARGMTGLYVTHDHDEAFSVADRLALIRDGKVVQVGPPGEVWARPAGAWAARFMGLSNIFSAEVRGGFARLPWGTVRVASQEVGQRTLVMRPQGIDLLPPDVDASGEGLPADDRALACVVTSTFRGGRYAVTVVLTDGSELEAEVEMNRGPAQGDLFEVQVDPEQVIILNDYG